MSFCYNETFQPQKIGLHPKLSVQDFIVSQGRESIQCFPSVIFRDSGRTPAGINCKGKL